jgi:uncharacterized protein (TIGR02246 family)
MSQTATSQTAASKATAAQILAAAGVPEDWSYYGPYVSDDERAVLAVPQVIQAAWAANDPELFADTFTENGSLLMGDTQLLSREEIRAFMAAGFEGPFRGARVSGWPLAVSFLTDEAAVVVTQGGIIMPGQTGIAPEREIRAVWVIVAQDGTWRLMSHQSSPIRG